MFCPKCGHELAQGAKFCDKCGASVESIRPADQSPAPGQASAVRPPEIYADCPQTVTEPPKPKKKKKKKVFLKIVAVLLIAVLFISTVAILGYFTFLPAKYTLAAAEYLTVQKSYKQLDSSLSRREKLIDSVYDGSVNSQSEVSFSIDPAVLTVLGMDSQTADTVRKALDNITLKFGAQADMSRKKENFSLSFNYMNNPALSINGFLDDKKLGLSIPELSKTSLVGQFKDIPRLGELYPDTFDQTALDSLANIDPWVSNKIHDEIRIKHEDIKKLMQTYAMAFVSNLESSDMSIKRGRTTELMGKEVGCQEVTIKLDQKAQKNLLVSLLNTARNDDTLYNVVFGNLKKIYDIMAEGNPMLADSFSSLGIDPDAILSKSSVRTGITQLKSSVTDDMFPEEMTVKAYIKGFEVVKYEFEVPLSDGGDNVVLTLESVINGDNVSKQVTIAGNANGENVNAVISYDKKYDKASDTQDTAVEFNMDISGSTSAKVNFKLASNEDPGGRNTVDRKTVISLSYNSDGEYAPVSQGELTISSKGTETRNKDGLPTGIDSKTDVTLNIPDSLPQPVTFSIGVKGETTYGDKVETPDWAARNTLDLATATTEDIDAYLQEITNTITNTINTLGSLISFGG